MFRTELDREIPCFIDQRILTIFIDWTASWAQRQKYTPEKLRHKRQDDLGYTNEECDHLGRIDMIEARFDEIAARYTDWDSIRFWWPHTGDKAYWKKRPNLKGVKTLPMKVRGKKLQIPVEFVEPLKCPM